MYKLAFAMETNYYHATSIYKHIINIDLMYVLTQNGYIIFFPCNKISCIKNKQVYHPKIA